MLERPWRVHEAAHGRSPKIKRVKDLRIDMNDSAGHGPLTAMSRRDFMRTAERVVTLAPFAWLLTACGSTPAAPGSSLSTASSAASRSSAAAPSSGPLNPTQKVNLGLVGLSAEAGFYIAEERGYFKEEGLQVETAKMGGTQQIAALASGQLDFGTGAPNAGLFNAIGREVPLKMVAPSAVLLPGSRDAAGILRQDYFDSGRYKEPKDIKGMTVAIPSRGNSNEMTLDTFLTRAGLTQADIDFKLLPFPDQLAALTNKSVDVAWSTEPFITIAMEKKTAQPMVWLADMWPNGVIQAVLLAPKFAE